MFCVAAAVIRLHPQRATDDALEYMYLRSVILLFTNNKVFIPIVC